ncbi:MAG: tetratricopeptide repeat protein [Chthoniobacterales bacterium]
MPRNLLFGPAVETFDYRPIPLPLKRVQLGAAVLILIAVIAYLPAITAGFIWDDDLLLTANPQLKALHGLAQVWAGKTCDYTPLTLTTFWLEQRLWQNTAIGYHVVNILLHATAAVLLWRILVAMRIPGAWLAALIFTIHPVNVASVAWIAERKNTLSAVFFFGSILVFIAGYKRGDSRLLWASAGLFVLAGASKGAVVGLPVVLLTCIYWMNRKLTRRDVIYIAPFAAIAVAIAVVTMHFQSAATDYGLAPSGLTSRAVRAGSLPWLYLGQLFLPVGLSPMSPVWNPALASLTTYLPGVLLALVLALFLWKRNGWGRPLLAAGGYYVWMLLPILGLVWMTLQQQAATADWWQYLAAPGVFAAMAAGFVCLVQRGSRPRIVSLYALLGVATVLLLVQTWRRCSIYESMETYCRAVLNENPHVWALQNNLGIIFKQRGDLVSAVACYQSALQDNPRYVQAHNNLGNIRERQDRPAEAEAEFRAALELEPHNPQILASLGRTYLRQGRNKEALATSWQSIRLDPANPDRYIEFGAALNANGQFEHAANCLAKALVLTPGDTRIQLELARTLMAAGRPEAAAAVCDSGLQTAQTRGDSHLIQVFADLRGRCRSSAE